MIYIQPINLTVHILSPYKETPLHLPPPVKLDTQIARICNTRLMPQKTQTPPDPPKGGLGLFFLGFIKALGISFPDDSTWHWVYRNYTYFVVLLMILPS